jgi:hypothetical protein
MHERQVRQVRPVRRVRRVRHVSNFTCKSLPDDSLDHGSCSDKGDIGRTENFRFDLNEAPRRIR